MKKFLSQLKSDFSKRLESKKSLCEDEESTRKIFRDICLEMANELNRPRVFRKRPISTGMSRPNMGQYGIPICAPKFGTKSK